MMCINLTKIFRKDGLKKADSDFIEDDGLLEEAEYDSLRKKKQYYKSHYKNGRKSSITPNVNTIGELSDLEEDAELCDFEPTIAANKLDTNQQRRLSKQLTRTRKQSLAGEGRRGSELSPNAGMADSGGGRSSQFRRESNLQNRMSQVGRNSYIRRSTMAAGGNGGAAGIGGGTLLSFLGGKNEAENEELPMSDFDNGMSEAERQKLAMWKRRNSNKPGNAKHRHSIISIDACNM